MRLLGTAEAGLLAAFISAALTPVARATARRLGVFDQPNARSSHSIPTPRTGGYAIVTAIAAAALAVGAFRDPRLLAVGLGALVLVVLAAVDEMRTLSRVGRFITQLLVGGLVAFALTRPDPGEAPVIVITLLVVAIVWIVWVTNAFNFMDGINGIASSSAVVAGVTMAIVFSRQGDLTAAGLAIVIAGAAAGFLPWNMTGTIFMGDVGSSTLGYLFACLSLRADSDGVFIPATLALAPLLFDATLTLFIRAKRGEPFFSTPHRSHSYQLLVQSGWSHASVTALWTGLALVCSATALSWPMLGGWGRTTAASVVLAAHAAVFAISRRAETERLVSSDIGR
jgi:UDP-GlcNAc:undecaprenyl-phosphate GlcNAc-1-phosphate transferase